MLTEGKAPEFARLISAFVEKYSDKVNFFAENRSGWEKWFQLELSYWFILNRYLVGLEQPITSSGEKQIRTDLEVYRYSGIREKPLKKAVFELKVGYDLSHMRYVFADIEKYATAEIENERYPLDSLHFALLYSTLKSKNTTYNKFIKDLLAQELYAWEMQSSDEKTKCVVLGFVVNPKSKMTPTEQLHAWVAEMVQLKEAANLRSRKK